MNPTLLEKLNPAQKESVTWEGTPLLILAGAGSGKTRILTHRIAYLISRGVPSFNILGITFTNKAAQEMKSRVQKLVQQDVWVSTFHSTCMRMLRMDGPAIGLDRNFSVYDDHDQLVLIKECMKELNINDKQVHPKGVRERISLSKDLLTTAYQYAEKATDLYEEAVGKIYKLYESKLEKLKACDFGDLIMKTVQVLDAKPAVLQSWQDRFQHILVDEYQDTNHAQYRLIRLLASKRRQITVVGDPDQSIYAWRGADIRNILNFEKDYPDCGIIRMEQNYRSTSTILDAANQLISRNAARKDKNLWTERKGGEKISLFEASDEKEEAFYTVQEIQRNIKAGKTLADQVIFYRTHAQSRVIEDVLRRFNIPYKIVGGVRFYDRKEIKDLIAYLRALAYPHDDVSIKRILNVPARGIGKKAVESLEEAVRVANISFEEALRQSDKIAGLPPKAKKSIADFCSMLTNLRKKKNEFSVSEILQALLERTRYVEELEAEKTVEAQARIENIEEFFSAIADFEATDVQSGRSAAGIRTAAEAQGHAEIIGSGQAGDKGDAPQSQLDAFLESISLVSDLDSWDNGTNTLTMMTLHTAKGLEFPVVYMVGMEEGIFPNVKSYSDDPEDLEEERRLCYVGITRAKDKLHMTFTRRRMLYGSTQYNLPSRFLNEIPQNLLDMKNASLMREAPQEAYPNDEIEIDFDTDEVKRRILFD